MTTITAGTDPDLTIFHISHRGMRRDSRRFAQLVATLDAESSGRATDARRWLRGFRAELHEHHTVEDTVFYPALLARVPSVAAPLARVDADHHQLDTMLDELDGSLRAIADGTATPAVAPAAARAADALAELLARHLDLEDADLLPLFVRHFTAEEYAELHSKALKAGRLADLAYAVPWLMDHATASEREHLLEQAPLPLRLLWYATRRRYARTVSRAFDAALVIPAPADAGAGRR
jgi:hypothetical protein